MYQVTFPPQSNRASWVFIGVITDLQDNPIDISNCSMVFAIRERNGGVAQLEASTANGKITYPDIGRFRWFFTLQEMHGLCAGSYDTGLTLTNDDGTQTIQLSVGPLPIVDGVVA
jgi:hypothetical protein